MDAPLYRLEGIRLVRGGRAILAVDALDIDVGEVCAVVGPNGAGKTTLLRVLAFLLTPDEGTLTFRGRLCAPSHAPADEFRRHVTLVMQKPYLFSGTVRQNAAYGLRARGVPAREARAKAEEALDLVGLSAFADRQARTLSGGEARRLAAARALVLETEVLLLDEPTADVDEENGRRLEALVSRVNRERGTTVVLSTHDRDQALRLSTRLLTLSEGRPVDRPPVNLFRGEVVRTEEGAFFRGCGVEMRVPLVEGGPALVSLEPSVIVLSLDAPRTSAQNVLPGRIVRLAEKDGRIRVTVDAGVELDVDLTPASTRNLGLEPGRDVFAVFKAHSIKVIPTA